MAAHRSSHKSRLVKTACVLKHSSSEQLQRCYEVSKLVNSPENVSLNALASIACYAILPCATNCLTLVVIGCLRRRLVLLVLDEFARLRCFNWRKHFELNLHQSNHP